MSDSVKSMCSNVGDMKTDMHKMTPKGMMSSPLSMVKAPLDAVRDFLP
jgi:hypothetical protein